VGGGCSTHGRHEKCIQNLAYYINVLHISFTQLINDVNNIKTSQTLN